MPDTIERRLLDGHLVSKARKLVGHAARFSTPTRIANEFTETIAPGAFRNTLRSKADVLALVDHDASRLLGRTRNDTLKLTEDDLGLSFEIQLPDTTEGRDILALAERGDLGGMSFGFRVAQGGEFWNTKRDERTLTNVDLIEVSVVSAFPAYPQTSVAARSQQQQHASRLVRRINLLELGGR